jgi:ABC-type uncharacterized transport system permease subunit
LGLLNGANGACKISINYYNPVTGAASTGTGGDVVEVSVVGYNYTPIGILKSASPIAITASSSDVMEACPLARLPADRQSQTANLPVRIPFICPQ